MKTLQQFFIRIVCFLMIGSSSLKAQDFDALIGKYTQAFEQKNVTEMVTACDNLIKSFPDSHWGYVLMSYSKLMQRNKEEAMNYWLNGINIAPLDYHALAIGACNFAAQGNTEKAKVYLHYAYQVNANPEAPKLMEEDLAMLNKYTPLALNELIAESKRITPIYANNSFFFHGMNDCFSRWPQGQQCATKSNLIANVKKWPKPIPYFETALLFFEAQCLLEMGDYQKGIPLVNLFLHDARNFPEMQHFVAASKYYKAEDEMNKLAYPAALIQAEEGLRAHDQIPVMYPNSYTAYLLERKLLALDLLERKQDVFKEAQTLLEISKLIGDTTVEVKAYNFIGGALLITTNPKEYDVMKSIFNQASQLTKNKPELEEIIGGNYASFLYREKRYAEAKQLVTRLAGTKMKQGKPLMAQTLYNNAGFYTNYQGEYQTSIDLFQKAINITEDFRNKLTPQQQLTLMDAHSSAYGGLILNYQKLGNSAALFEVQEQNRSRFLRERLNPKSKALTLQQAQALLQPKEALVYYSTGSRPGDIIIHVITANKSVIKQNYPLDEWIAFKKKYLNTLMGRPESINGIKAGLLEDVVNGSLVAYSSKEEAFKKHHFEEAFELTRELLKSDKPELKQLRDEFLSHWYNYVITPILPDIKDKISLKISAEEHLNLLPFEAFISPNGKYLIEEFEVNYIPSMTVLAEVSKRNYPDTRKPVLAMGGATYLGKSPSVTSAERGLIGFYQVQQEVQQNLAKGMNISQQLAKLGFGLEANYLAGTLKEVQMIKQMIPEADILIDQEMRESVIKTMDKKGELAQYKFIHIATHGFVYEAIPELAGLMMTSPPEGDGVEDTFLIAPEIANMNLQADMAILSACDTGTGKFYRGEGINGLNSALMIGGANGTLLSLWPVSDQGTMVLMTLLYDMVFNQNIPSDKALNAVKRYMISGQMGDFYSDPVIWAPFVYSGR